MPFSRNDALLGPSRGTPAQALSYAKSHNAKRSDQVEPYINELYRLCTLPEVGIDFALAYAQFCEETGVGSSPYWEKYLNPAGIGALETMDRLGQVTYVGTTYATGVDAARAHVVHLYVYTRGAVPQGHALAGYVALDPRYDAALKAGYGGVAKKLADLAKRWAADPDYAAKILTHATGAFGDGAAPPAPAPSPTPTKQVTGADLYAWGVSKVGKIPYVFGGSSERGVDCSGFVALGVRTLTGQEITHDSHAQMKLGVAIDRNDVQPGDLLFWDTAGGKEVREGNAASHVGISGGGSQMVNALNDTDDIKVSDISSDYWAHQVRFLGARRILPAPNAPAATPAPSPTPAPNPAPAPQPLDQLPFPLHVKLIPVGQTNQRPGIKQNAKWVNVHETGNPKPGATAAMHSQWQDDGCPGVEDKQIGVHFYIDDHEAYQKLPLDEVSWNAGCGQCEGNYAAISFEICINSDGDREQARRNAAILIAAVMHKLGLGPSAIKFHNDWSGKWCPAIILNEGLKGHMVDLIVAAYNNGGASLPDVSEFVKPSPVPAFDGTNDVTFNGAFFHAEKRTVTSGADGVNVRQWAALSALPTRAPLKKGDTFPVLGWVSGEMVNEFDAWWVTETYSRVWVGGTNEKPTPAAPPTPAPTPTPAPAPTPAPTPSPQPDNPPLPGVPDSAPKIIDGKRVYILGADGKGRDITAIADGVNVRRFADPAADVVRVLKNGEKAHAAYWTISAAVDGEPVWWVLSDLTYVSAVGIVERPL